MNTVTFDKLRYIEKLQAGGISSEQAKVQAEALDDALRETVATQHDVELLRRDMELLRRDMKIWSMGQAIVIISVLSALKFFG